MNRHAIRAIGVAAGVRLGIMAQAMTERRNEH